MRRLKWTSWIPRAAILLGLSSPSFAWDGTVSGTIYRVELASDWAGFRVYLENAPPLCGNSNSWAYVDTSEANYKSFVAGLLMAKAQALSVTLYANRDTSGYCHLGYVSIT